MGTSHNDQRDEYQSEPNADADCAAAGHGRARQPDEHYREPRQRQSTYVCGPSAAASDRSQSVRRDQSVGNESELRRGEQHPRKQQPSQFGNRHRRHSEQRQRQSSQIGAFMNPYTTSVIGSENQLLNQQFGQQNAAMQAGSVRPQERSAATVRRGAGDSRRPTGAGPRKHRRQTSEHRLDECAGGSIPERGAWPIRWRRLEISPTSKAV